MNKQVRTKNNDNGLVDRTQEAILAGVNPCKPEDICTKYPETCTAAQVSPDECNTGCCIEHPQPE